MKNVLIVEDESIVALEISYFVKELGYNVYEVASNAKKAIEIVQNNVVDIILMDVYIKGDMDGIDCVNAIKKIQDIPIIYISAFSDDETLDRAIETNPTTYLIKPFNRKELKIAIKIATKRERRKGDFIDMLQRGDVILDNEFSFDSKNRELFMLGEKIHLTKQEQQLLSLLINSKNSIVSIYELENEIWPYKESNENTRRALISRLRSKLKHKHIETLHSIGYKINI